MNKARRHELKLLKLKKRLANYQLTGKVGNFFAFRTTGKPCSCWVCQQPEDNYNRMAFKKESEILSKEMIDGDACDEDREFVIDCILNDRPMDGLTKLEYVLNSEFEYE